MKKILACVAAFAITFSSTVLPIAEQATEIGVVISASADTYGDFQYSVLNDGTIAITKYTGKTENLTIPAYINGKQVTSIGNRAFYSNRKLESIKIPNGVKKIENNAFENCDILKNVTLPNGLTSIGTYAFHGCTCLESIDIPQSVVIIGASAFEDCNTLKKIDIKNGVKSIGKNAFSATSIKNLTLPDTITCVEDNTFTRCLYLENITIPDGVTSIGDLAFSECPALKSIILPDSVTSLGKSMFFYCTSLSDITLSANLTTIPEEAFFSCTNLDNVIIPNGVVRIEKSAFSSCSGMKKIDIPDSVETIGEKAFSDCSALTNVVIPDSITSIEKYAFLNCYALRDIKLSSNIDNIPEQSFLCCKSLESITIPENVKTIENEAFKGCENLSAITMSNGLNSIEYKSFSGCKKLTNIFIPDSVSNITYNAFEGCTALADISVSNDNTSFSSDEGVLFNKDKTALLIYPLGLKQSSYTIPGSVTSIGNGAFENCDSLTDIIIPDSVTYIGTSSFSGCTNLTHIKMPTNIDNIPSSAFARCKSLVSIDIPESVKYIGSATFSECSSLTTVTIPKSTEYIEIDTFYFCDSLISINVDPDNQKYCSKDGVWFDKAMTQLMQYPANSSRSDYTIPDTINTIAYRSFFNCKTLKNITIPKSVNSIGMFAFYDCTNLKNVYYKGSKADWEKINILDFNECLTNSTRYYNYDPNHKHSYTNRITKQPTCTVSGTRTYTCSCGDSYTETIPATGHKSSGWIVDKAASIGVKGSKHRECTVCKKVLETAEIPALSRISISKASVTLSTSTYAYDGKAKKPGVTVKLNGKTLKNGTDYTVSYSNNTKVGTAKVTITGKGNYTGSVSKTFKIKNNFKKATVLGISTKAFTGKNITQSITVKYNGKTLKNGTDYTVSYSSNKNIGTATVKIAGKGSYTGTITKTFKINPAKQKIQKLTAKSKAFFVDWAQKGSATGYEIQYATNSKFTSAKKVTITNNKTDTKTISKLSGKKKYYVRVRSYTTVKGTKYYGAWSASKSVTTKK